MQCWTPEATTLPSAWFSGRATLSWRSVSGSRSRYVVALAIAATSTIITACGSFGTQPRQDSNPTDEDTVTTTGKQDAAIPETQPEIPADAGPRALHCGTSSNVCRK